MVPAMDPTATHRIPIRLEERIAPTDGSAESAVPANLYRSPNYLVVEVGLPRCLPGHIELTLAPGRLRVDADRHPGSVPAEAERDYQLHELPSGHVRRTFDLRTEGLALDAAEAHFANGMLTVSIPTEARAAHRQAVRGGAP